jgi:type II secretory pathway component PulM
MGMPTPEERIARLESYLQDLRTEAAMVEQRIAELKAA